LTPINFKFIDHTADFGIQVFGGDAKELFRNAALAMFDLIVEPELPRDADEKSVSISGVDLPDLLVNWLRELLYLWAGREEILIEVTVDELNDTGMSARVKTAAFKPDRDCVLNEIKAVTYHQIDVVKKKDHWETRIIFDV
jgi:SHS2 domain-containing protein